MTGQQLIEMKVPVVDIIAASLILDFPGNLHSGSLFGQVKKILGATIPNEIIVTAKLVHRSLVDYLFLDLLLDQPTVNFGVDMLQLLTSVEVNVSEKSYREFIILMTVPYMVEYLKIDIEEYRKT